MRLLILTFLFLNFSLNLKAQFYEIDLSDYKFVKPVQNIRVEQIIDLRNDRSNIGWVWAGLGNKKVSADFDDNFTAALGTFINNNSSFSGQRFPVIIKVNKFKISERFESAREYATAEISLEFLAKKDSGYCKISETSRIVETSSGIDVTDNHPENIVKALEDCFNKLASVNFTEKFKTAEVLSADYLKVNSYNQLTKLNLPVLKTENFKEGVYKSFTEFINNSPGSSGGHILTVKEALHLTSLGNELDDLWGFSDGKTAYIFQGSSHFPLTRKENHFTFKAFVPTINVAAILAGAIIAGIPGSLVANSISTDYVEVEFAVSMISGKIFVSEDYNPLAELSKPAKIVVYRKTKNETRNKLGLYVNDSLSAELLPYTIKVINFYYPVPELNICLKGGTKSSIKVSPVIGETKYFECSLSNKSGSEPEIIEMSEQKAQYYLNKIRDFRADENK